MAGMMNRPQITSVDNCWRILDNRGSLQSQVIVREATINIVNNIWAARNKFCFQKTYIN